MMIRLRGLLALTALAGVAACGKKDADDGGTVVVDSTAAAPAAAPAAMPGDSTGQPPYVVPNGEPMTPANGAAGRPAPGDTVYGNAGPAGASAPGGKDTLVTQPKP